MTRRTLLAGVVLAVSVAFVVTTGASPKKSKTTRQMVGQQADRFILENTTKNAKFAGLRKGFAQGPVRVPKTGLPAGPLTAPKHLSALGVKGVNLFVLPNPMTVSMQLVGQDGHELGTVTMTEKELGNTLEYSVKTQDEDVGIVVNSDAPSPVSRVLTVKASTGASLRFELQLGNPTPGHPPSVVSVTGYADERLVGTLTATDVQLRASGLSGPSMTNPIAQAEDGIMLTTPAFRLLKAAISDFPDLKKALLAPVRVRPVSFTRTMAGSGCDVLCIRMATLLPIYVCDDGFWSGCYCDSEGIWLMQCQDGGYLWCWQDCGYWYNGSCGAYN